jgi:hypothetical protein
MCVFWFWKMGYFYNRVNGKKSDSRKDGFDDGKQQRNRRGYVCHSGSEVGILSSYSTSIRVQW